MMSLDERLDKAEEMIQKPSFRENKGLGNEVGYYIFDYPAEKELYIRERIEYIKKKSENSDDDFKVVVFDLYDIMIDILIKKGYLEKCYQFEKTKGFERVSKSISNMLRITSSDSLIVNHIRDGITANMIRLFQMRITAFQLQTRNILKMILLVCFVLG